MPQNSDANSKVTAVILAGGAGRRMDGQDKGLMPFRGQALIAHVLDTITPQVNNVFINCNRNAEAYARFGYPLMEDSLPGGLGPLAGLLSALESVADDYVLSVPCDTPFLPTDLVTRMLEGMQQSGADVCTVDDGDRLHPVILLVRRSLAASLKRYLLSGKRKVHDWYYSEKHCQCDFSDQAGSFINLNTPDQLQAAEQS